MIKNLLLIDDDETTLTLLTRTVIKSGFAENVITLKNGKEGIDYFQKLAQGGPEAVPDLVFLDIIMPVMDGWDFMNEYSQRFEHLFPNTPFCILSSSPEPEDQEKASEFSCVICFWKKPLFVSELETIKQHERLKSNFDTPE